MTVPTETLMRPYDHPSAWRGADLAMRDDWRIVLDADHNRELRRALAHARARGVQVPALRAADFPLPTLAPVIEAMRREVMDGRGFCLVKGLRIDDLSTADAALIYWGVGSHVGSVTLRSRPTRGQPAVTRACRGRRARRGHGAPGRQATAVGHSRPRCRTWSGPWSGGLR